MDTRDALVRCGMEILTEKSFASTGIEDILKCLNVPKGSFYHYFDSKEAFGCAVIDSYAAYFARKLDRLLLDPSCSPLQRVANFIADACQGMERHHFQRGCLIGNLGQEMNSLPEAFRVKLEAAFLDWQDRLAACLRLARSTGELTEAADCEQLSVYFWIAWEGAVLRAKLIRDSSPLLIFARGYFSGLPYAPGHSGLIVPLS
ncbi:TetR/AcrR family transcriptional regulator [Dechloromonas denitrificans]|jgi:TetR/AcrR family transcriptional repressor of nem operon|uniref:acrylate utilization transcriptional regulator AcuR n=1 Tax=Dechloromonas denitrificans TaxID=281362 RepID=UPI001CF8CA2E|nr:TetR/AcrR family transcriptional regulator [Dechloromonas denitrificans]UCV05623.1 TetR/AcrR family transcriptional regulator [Dechloromonas denitrificans]